MVRYALPHCFVPMQFCMTFVQKKMIDCFTIKNELTRKSDLLAVCRFVGNSLMNGNCIIS